MSSKWQLFRVVVSVIAISLAVLGWLGTRLKQGKKLAISNVETVNYSGSATEQDARALGDALKAIEYFNGQDEVDVLLNKGDAGTVVSFVVIPGAWDDSVIVSGYETHGRRIAAALGGPPLTVQLVDGDLKTQKSMQIVDAETLLKHTEQEAIWYRTGITEDDARLLGKALQEAGYFDNTAPATVLYRQNDGSKEVSFVVQDGGWDNPQTIEYLTSVGQQVAPVLGGGALTVSILDTNLTPHKTLSIP